MTDTEDATRRHIAMTKYRNKLLQRKEFESKVRPGPFYYKLKNAETTFDVGGTITLRKRPSCDSGKRTQINLPYRVQITLQHSMRNSGPNETEALPHFPR